MWGDKKPSREELELLALVLSLIETALSIMASFKVLLEG